MLCLFENYVNTFISLDFGVYIFLISLLYIGTEIFNQNLVIPIFLTGILYINKHNEMVMMYITFDRLYLDTTKFDKTTTTKNIDVYSPK